MIGALLAALGFTGGLGLASIVLGDAATAAAIAGAFSVINTGLTALLLGYARGTRRQVRNTHTSVAHAAVAAQGAAEAAVEACRVAKSIGAAIRHEDPLIVATRDTKPGPPPTGPPR